jgi:hypothetical protein
MSDPLRLRDAHSDGDDGLRALLVHARRSSRASAGERARVAARVAQVAQVATVPVAATTFAISLKALAAGAAIAGAVVVGAETLPAWLSELGASPPEPPRARVTAVTPPAAPRANPPPDSQKAKEDESIVAPQAPPPVVLPPVAPPPEAPPPEARTPVAPPRVQESLAAPAPPARPEAKTADTAPRAAAVSPEDLSREAALLERARRAMAEDPTHPDVALAALDEHARAFPNGVLGEEREVLRVDALCRAGRRSEGRAIARALIERSPAGLYTRRIAALLARCE